MIFVMPIIISDNCLHSSLIEHHIAELCLSKRQSQDSMWPQFQKADISMSCRQLGEADNDTASAVQLEMIQLDTKEAADLENTLVNFNFYKNFPVPYLDIRAMEFNPM